MRKNIASQPVADANGATVEKNENEDTETSDTSDINKNTNL